MSELQYFTPNIEDIRVGYEMYAPVIEDGKETGRLVKVVINSADWANQICDISNSDDKRVYSLGDIWKIPYLTKEQIVAEGWELDQDDTFIKKGIWVDEKGLECSISFKLKLVKQKQHGVLIWSECSFYNIFSLEKHTIYDGNCRCINDLRFICKLNRIDEVVKKVNDLTKIL